MPARFAPSRAQPSWGQERVDRLEVGRVGAWGRSTGVEVGPKQALGSMTAVERLWIISVRVGP